MNDLMNFSFDQSQVRVVMREGDPWFVLADVCRVLDVDNPRQASSRLDQDEKDTVNINDGIRPGNPNVTIINESGLYSLILTSRKPEAKRFKKWVTGTVLPAIRKDGGYIAGEEKLATGEIDEDALMARALQVAAAKLERLAIERDTAMEAIRAAAPKVAFHDTVRNVVNCIGIGEFAKEIGAGEIRFFKWLRDNGYLLSSRAHHNQPAQRYVDQGIFRLVAGKPWKTPAGEWVQGDPRTVITGKGQIYLAKKWRGEDPQADLLAFEVRR